MLNIRTITLSVVLVLILMLTAQLVTARTEIVSDPLMDAAGVSEIQEQSADWKNTYSAPSYRSQFGECFDVSISEVTGCREASQTTVQSNHSALDECFDVSISEVASCRNASQASTP